MTEEEQIKAIKQALEDKKAVDIRVYDVRGKSGLCNYHIVATGSVGPHIKALVAETQAVMKKAGVNSFRTAGDPESGWVLVDYIDIVVHAFTPEARAYYAIEKLWTK